MFDSNHYSRLDRAVHNLAFGPKVLQEILADIESNLFSKNWADVEAKKPIFITSLPRAGTTVILEALHRLPALATHTYRDMPFVLTPVLWTKLCSHFRRKSSQLQERAHGDGLAVNEESPEAFEEVLWLNFFTKEYSDSSISLWDKNNVNTSFKGYFREHMQKMVYLRCPENIKAGRYISKNNGNISRTQVIKVMFPDAFIVIPVRNPVDHAISLLRQHENFLKRHQDDPFVCKYMRDIGHFEFGELHRRVTFAGGSEATRNFSLDSVDYWLAYWIAGFKHLIQQNNIDFLSYEALCTSGVNGLSRLCHHLEIEVEENEIADAAQIFRPPSASRKDEYPIDSDLLEQAVQLYEQLNQRCLLNLSR